VNSREIVQCTDKSKCRVKSGYTKPEFDDSDERKGSSYGAVYLD